LAETISGRIINPSGEPLATTQIQIRSKRDSKNISNLESVFWTTTDAHGKFESKVPRSGFCEILVVPDPYAPHRIPVGEQRGDLGDITVVEGIRTAGRAVDLSGEPVSGAWVNLSPIDLNPQDRKNNSEAMSRSCQTDKEGKFSLGPVEPGTYQLGIHTQPREIKYRSEKQAPANTQHVFIDQKIEIISQDLHRDQRLQAIPHVTFRGHCLDLDGNPRKARNIQASGFVDGVFYSTAFQSNENGQVIGVLPTNLEQVRFKIDTYQFESVHVHYGEVAGPVKNDALTFERIPQDILDAHFFLYDSASVFIKLFDKDGNTLHKCIVSGVYQDGPTTKLLGIERKSVGFAFKWNTNNRLLSTQLLPNRNITLKLAADGYETAFIDLLVPPSGERKEIAVVLDRANNMNEAAKKIAREKNEELVAALLKKTEAGDATADVHFQLGSVYFNRNDAGKAEFHWRMALALDPEHTLTMNNLAVLLAISGSNQIDEALELIDRALELVKGDKAEFLDSKGEILIRAQRYTDAIDAFKSVLKINPMRLSAREKLIQCYEKLGDRDAAEVERKLVESLRSRTNTGAKSKK
jgi:tetratricopeptide (TPR) repeat protein